MLDFLVDGVWYICLYGIAVYIAILFVARFDSWLHRRVAPKIDKFFNEMDAAYAARELREKLEQENKNKIGK